MVTKEQFIKLIETYQAWNKYVEEAGNFLKSDITECPLVNYTDTLFNHTMDILFSKNANDTIDWYLFEKDMDPDLKMYDKNHNEIPTETIEDLWNIVKNDRK